MQTLSYGFYKPASGDKGSVFWSALTDNMQMLNDHTHNGSNSARLTATAITAETQSIASGSWVSVGGGTYRQLVTCPAGITYDGYLIFFKHASSKEQMLLKVERASSNTYYVYINDNSVALTAYYVS